MLYVLRHRATTLARVIRLANVFFSEKKKSRPKRIDELQKRTAISVRLSFDIFSLPILKMKQDLLSIAKIYGRKLDRLEIRD